MDTYASTAAKTSPKLSNQRVSQRLPEETDVLRRAGVALVSMEYDGHYGDRDLGKITLHDADGRVVSHAAFEAVVEQIAVFFHELLEIRFTGWETAEGARGAFEWLIDADVLDHRHDVRFVDYLTAKIENL